MSGSTSGRADPDHGQEDQAVLRVASGQDAADAAQRAGRLQEILVRADARDQAAERRDRAGERGDKVQRPRTPSVVREWAGRDRDDAATDRADLVELLQAYGRDTPFDDEDPR